MDVTPTEPMYRVMSYLTDMFVGEEPGKLEKSAPAEKRRADRRAMMDVLHRLVHLSMREGAARAMDPRRQPVVKSALDRATRDALRDFNIEHGS